MPPSSTDLTGRVTFVGVRLDIERAGLLREGKPDSVLPVTRFGVGNQREAVVPFAASVLERETHRGADRKRTIRPNRKPVRRNIQDRRAQAQRHITAFVCIGDDKQRPSLRSRDARGIAPATLVGLIREPSREGLFQQ